MSEGEQTVVKATVQINWRKLLLSLLLIMVLPTISAIMLDMWFKSPPYITIVAILICFPTATISVTRIALSEIERVVAEVAPPLPLEVPMQTEVPMRTEGSSEAESAVKASSAS